MEIKSLKKRANKLLEEVKSGNWSNINPFLEDLNLGFTFLEKAVIDILGHIADLEEGDEVEDLVLEWVDGDVPLYTGDLTSWLAEDVNHVVYITSAIEEFGAKDSLPLLQMAYYLALEDVYNKVLNGLIEEGGV